MAIIVDSLDERVVNCLLSGGLVALRTDTLYGLVTRAEDEAAVERLYRVKQRDMDKASIVLIAELSQLFEDPDQAHLRVIEAAWPGPVSIIIPSISAPAWVSRGVGSVAYRMPDVSELRDLILKTGPLVAPSANPQGQSPASNVSMAIEYFGDLVDIYVDGGEVDDLTPSRLIRLSDDGTVERIR